MPSPNDFTSRGKIIAIKDDCVVFTPSGSRYELNLKHTGDAPPLNTLTDVLIRATARKVWTVPSGGNFVTPIVGPSRIVQGRVEYLSDRELVVHAGPHFVIDLPSNPSAIDLPQGAIAIGRMVNVTLLPGARVELANGRAAGAAAANGQESINSVR